MNNKHPEFSVYPEDVSDWIALMSEDVETDDSYQQSAIAEHQSPSANGSRG